MHLLCNVSRHCRWPRKLFIARSNVISHEARESLSICVYSSLISRSFLCFRENAKALMFTGNHGSYLFSRATYIRAAKSLVVSLFTSIYFLLSSPPETLPNSRRMPEKASLLSLKWELWLNDDNIRLENICRYANTYRLIHSDKIFNAVHLKKQK